MRTETEMLEETRIADELYKELRDAFQEYRDRDSLRLFLNSYSQLIKTQDYISRKWKINNSFKKDFLREV